jgi:hypothetical protein
MEIQFHKKKFMNSILKISFLIPPTINQLTLQFHKKKQFFSTKNFFQRIDEIKIDQLIRDFSNSQIKEMISLIETNLQKMQIGEVIPQWTYSFL